MEKKKGYYHLYRISPQRVQRIRMFLTTIQQNSTSQREICLQTAKTQEKQKSEESSAMQDKNHKAALKKKKLNQTDKKVRYTTSSATVGSRSLQHTLCWSDAEHHRSQTSEWKGRPAFTQVRSGYLNQVWRAIIIMYEVLYRPWGGPLQRWQQQQQQPQALCELR